MTDQPMMNGRTATQSDIYALGARLDKRFDRIDERMDSFDSRLRREELRNAKGDGIEAAAHAAETAADAVLEDRRLTGRWRVGIAVTVISILITNLMSLAALFR